MIKKESNAKKDFQTARFCNTVFYDLQQTARYAKFMARQVFSKVGELTPPELGALATMLENPGICQRDLAKIILRDRAGTGRILDSLESKGYIVRDVDTKNNRLVRKVEVTDSGEEVLNKSMEKLFNYYKVVTDQITQEEIDSIRAGLKKIRDGLSNLVEIQI